MLGLFVTKEEEEEKSFSGVQPCHLYVINRYRCHFGRSVFWFRLGGTSFNSAIYGVLSGNCNSNIITFTCNTKFQIFQSETARWDGIHLYLKVQWHASQLLSVIFWKALDDNSLTSSIMFVHTCLMCFLDHAHISLNIVKCPLFLCRHLCSRKRLAH